jgi:hypothetical protein
VLLRVIDLAQIQHMPLHHALTANARHTATLAFSRTSEGATALMVAGNSMGTNWKGHYTRSLPDFYGRSRRVRANGLSETVKLVVLLGQYIQDNYQGRYYAKPQNLARATRRLR